MSRWNVNPENLAKASSHYPWRVIVFWIIVLLTMGFTSGRLLNGVLSQDVSFTSKPESVQAQQVIDQKFTVGNKVASTEFVIVHSDRYTVNTDQFRSTVDKLHTKITDLGTDALANPVTTYYMIAQQNPAQARALISGDQHTMLIPVGLKKADTKYVEKLRDAAKEADGAFTVQVGGNATLGADFSTIAEQDLRKGEMIGIAVALIVLIVVFGSIVAAVVPIIMGLFAIGVSMGLVALIGQLVHFNLFVTNMVSMIGLAVGIDYSLFIVSRYREERKKGFDKHGAIIATGATANRAVFFSGLTVILALLGMMIIPVTIFRSLAGGAIIVTFAALLASMTLLPAVLSLLGDKINWPRLAKRARLDSDHDPKGGFWDKTTRLVMKYPVVFLVASVLALGSLGSYYFQLNRGTSQNVSQLPDAFASKKAFQTLEKDFSGGLADPARIIVTGNVQDQAVSAAVQKLRDHLAATSTFAPQTTLTTSKDGQAMEIDAYFKGDPQANASFKAIRDLRNDPALKAINELPDVSVKIGGSTAFFTDFLDIANRYQWIVVAFVLTLSFLLLTVVFRSVVLPLKAILMNLLSVGAAYGALTLVFQKGIGIGFFNDIGFKFQRTDAIEAWLPLFLFSVLFGLSMDYHVFLLSRIREEFDKTHDNTEAVAYGLRTTAGIITGAALIMVAVFTGFAAGRLGPLQQMGFGLAVSVLMDATIVRSLLVPASMRLLGNVNWYLPKWLRWLPSINVEGHEPALKTVK